MQHTPTCRPRTERFGLLTVEARPDPKCTAHHDEPAKEQQ